MGLNIHIIALPAGFLLDKILGDPRWFPHPVVGFGKMISLTGNIFNRGKNRLLKGALVSLFLVSFVFIFFYGIITIAFDLSIYSGLAVEAVLIFTGLAGTTLIREGKAVFGKLEESLNAGRARVSRIVGRDTSNLTADQVRTATLETLAENLSDGVIAPLFWYAIAGVPGMMTYKMVNTLDSMIGYKNERYLYFGRFAARMDDVANFVPARLTAALMTLCSGSFRPIRFIFKYGKAHASPNAGYPEAALAGILDARFGGSNSYFGKVVEKPYIGSNPRALTLKDLSIAVRTIRLSETLLLLVILILMYFGFCPLFNLSGSL